MDWTIFFGVLFGVPLALLVTYSTLRWMIEFAFYYPKLFMFLMLLTLATFFGLTMGPAKF